MFIHICLSFKMCWWSCFCLVFKVCRLLPEWENKVKFTCFMFFYVSLQETCLEKSLQAIYSSFASNCQTYQQRHNEFFAAFAVPCLVLQEMITRLVFELPYLPTLVTNGVERLDRLLFILVTHLINTHKSCLYIHWAVSVYNPQCLFVFVCVPLSATCTPPLTP